jgi:hypothetical protein
MQSFFRASVRYRPLLKQNWNLQPTKERCKARFLTTEAEEIYKPRKRLGLGTIALCTIPFITFGLGTWQVQRLRWKTHLIEDMEERMAKSPIPLPRRVK